MSERELRPAGTEDHLAVVEIIQAADLLYRGETDFTLEILREQIVGDSGFDSERDLVVVEASGSVLAYAMVNGQLAFAGIRPEHEDPQLRGELIRWAEARQRDQGRDAYRAGCDAVNAAAVASYESSGYRIERVYAQMVRSFELTGPPAPAELDPAYTLRLADRDADAAVLHQLNERAFDQEFGHEPETLEDFTRGYLTFSQFDPAGTLIVETAGRDPAGCLVGWRPLDHPHGYVASLAVDPEHRRRGLARAMLLSAFAAIHAAGLPAAELHVASDNPRALDLYRGVGMHEGERINNYIRAV